MRVGLYARYSSDQQRAASILDQFRECHAFAARQGWTVVGEHHDAAASGASILRAGFQALMRDALAGRFDVVLAESLDRFSRDQEDTAGLFKRLTFAGVSIVTLAEGDITHLHIGLKGTMNALHLKELADKTRRGLRGRVEVGKSAGGLCYGYRLGAETGDRTIVLEEAALVVRIFSEYADGRSPEQIAKRLNEEGICGPSGGTWGPSTIHGHASRGTGILNNELYVGRLVWNRLRYVKDPDTGRRVSRLNPRELWETTHVPELRIVDDELWTRAKARQGQFRRAVRSAGNTRGAHRPLHLFSGLTRCGVCGSSYVMYSAHRLACAGRRERGICTNALTIRRDEVEARVLRALQDRFFENGPFELFCQEFTAAINETRMEQRATVAGAKRELAQLESRRKKLVESIMDGVPGHVVKDELTALVARRDGLTALLEAADDVPPLLHPNMAEEWRRQIVQLRDALAEDRCDPIAREAVRSMVQEIRLTPVDGVLVIDVKGDLAAMLGAASPSEDWQRQITLVAGAGFEPATFGL